MKISFIGLGAMGYPMAGHLSRHHELTVWNRTAAVADRHRAEHGSVIADSLDACADASVIVTCLPTSREVDEVIEALHPNLPDGALWIDATSGDPESGRRQADRLRERGAVYVDAPVSGGVNGAMAATLTVMAGGSNEAFVRMKEVAAAWAKTIIHVGATGSGHAIKAINNALLGANLLTAAEGIVLASRFGIDARTALAVLNAGSGRSFVSETLLPPRLVDGEWPMMFRLALHDKDIRIANAMAHESQTVAPLLALVGQMFAAALNDNPDGDYVEVARWVETLNRREG